NECVRPGLLDGYDAGRTAPKTARIRSPRWLRQFTAHARSCPTEDRGEPFSEKHRGPPWRTQRVTFGSYPGERQRSHYMLDPPVHSSSAERQPDPAHLRFAGE